MKKWKRTLYGARSRCNNSKSVGYKYYGGKGIKCLLTIQEIEFLWKRDKADDLLRPSIDRIDANGNYEFTNCRFIELSENSKLSFGPEIERICKQCGIEFMGVKRKLFCSTKCNVRYGSDIYGILAIAERIKNYTPEGFFPLWYLIETGGRYLVCASFDWLSQNDPKIRAKEKLKEAIAKAEKQTEG